MNQAIHQSSCQTCIDKHLIPLAEFQITREEDDAFGPIPVTDQLEEQFGVFLGERNITHFIQNNQLHLVKAEFEGLQRIVPPLTFQLFHQIRDTPEARFNPCLAIWPRAQAKCVLPVPGVPTKMAFYF